MFALAGAVYIIISIVTYFLVASQVCDSALGCSNPSLVTIVSYLFLTAIGIGMSFLTYYEIRNPNKTTNLKLPMILVAGATPLSLLLIILYNFVSFGVGNSLIFYIPPIITDGLIVLYLLSLLARQSRFQTSKASPNSSSSQHSDNSKSKHSVHKRVL